MTDISNELDLQLIEETIQELEQEPTSFENCNTLASLYILSRNK